MHRHLDINADTITQAVIASHAQAPDARLREVLTSLVQQLHTFVREVRLSEAEFAQGLRFLAEAGQLSEGRDGAATDRQELGMLSDILGLSTLVAAQTHTHPRGCTEATPQQPLQREAGAPLAAGGWLMPTAQGTALYVRGQVRAHDGTALAGAELQVWQGSQQGVQAARCVGNAQGHYRFSTALPQPLPLPQDGPAGRLLKALGREAWRPAHLQFQVSAPGHHTLATQVFRDGDPHLEQDAAFAVRRSLVTPWREHPPGPTPDGTLSANPFFTLDFDFVLQPWASAKLEASPLKRAA